MIMEPKVEIDRKLLLLCCVLLLVVGEVFYFYFFLNASLSLLRAFFGKRKDRERNEDRQQSKKGIGGR